MANLASIIMEGSGYGTPSVDLGNYDYSDKVITESSYLNSAFATLFTDIMEAEQSFMVTDIIGAATVIRENSLGNNVDVVAVAEGAIGNAIEKIKNAFRKFINKIKEFYHKVINWFKAMFSDAEKFVKNFGDTIRAKSRKAKGFKYSGFKYDLSKGTTEADKVKKAVEGQIDGALTGFNMISDNLTKAEFKEKINGHLDGNFKEDGQESASDKVEKFLSTIHYSDIDDLRTSLTEIFRGDSTSKEVIEDFEGNSVDTMLKFLKDSNKTISKLNKDLTKFEEKVKKVIGWLDKLDKLSDNDATNDAKVSNASYLSSVITAYLNLYKVPCNVEIAINKEVAKEWLGALKKFYNFKPAKESAEVFDAELYATLETSMLLESDDEYDDDDKSGKGGKDTEECTESAISSILDMASNFSF